MELSKTYTTTYFKDVFDGLNTAQFTNLQGIEQPLEQGMNNWIDETQKRKNQKGIFFFCGNGASATMAEHLSHDAFQNGDMLTETVSETSHLTAIANDLSYEEVFAYRISKMMEEKDMLITISSSGNSPNVIRAIEEARKKGAFIVTLSGKGADNKSRKLGDLNFWVPLKTYGMVESAHAVFLHTWLDMFMDKYMNGRH